LRLALVFAAVIARSESDEAIQILEEKLDCFASSNDGRLTLSRIPDAMQREAVLR